MEMVHPPGPLHAPPQLPKANPLAAVARSATDVPSAKSPAQVEEPCDTPVESQSIGEGAEVTRPFPCTMTVSRCCPCGGGVLCPVVLLSSPPPQLSSATAIAENTMYVRMVGSPAHRPGLNCLRSRHKRRQ